MPSSLQGDTAFKHVFGKLTNMCWCSDGIRAMDLSQISYHALTLTALQLNVNQCLQGLLHGFCCQCSSWLVLQSLVLPVQGEAEADTNMTCISLHVLWIPDQA